MKLRYMIDMILRDGKGEKPAYEPVGVWVQGPGPGLDIEMFYQDSRDSKVLARKEAADWVINRLVENEATSLSDDFLEYHRDTRSPYDGAFTEPAETERFASLEACCLAMLDTLPKKKWRRQ